MVRFRMHTFVAVPSGPYAVGEHAVALMCSLKLSSKLKFNKLNLLDILIFRVQVITLGLTSRQAAFSGWWPPIWVIVFFVKCKFPNSSVSLHISIKRCIDFQTDELEPKKEISKLTCLVFPRTCPVFHLEFQDLTETLRNRNITRSYRNARMGNFGLQGTMIGILAMESA